MKQYKRKISKTQYEIAIEHGGYITPNDMNEIFSEAEICGYGIYSPIVKKENGEYFVYYYMGSCCD